MKNILKTLVLAIVAITFNACEETLIVYDQGQFAQINNASATSITENSGTIVTIEAILAMPATSSVTINLEATGADASRFSLTPSTITIAAGETSGSADFMAIDNDDIDGDVDVTIALASSSSVPVGIGGEGTPEGAASKVITIVDDNVPCNDIFVSITTDRWGGETSWQITDGTGAVVASDGPYVNLPANGDSATYDNTVNLPDGCYTFTIFDSYGDGQDYGTYSVTCGALVHASGGGDMDDANMSESTDFCVNL
ncbi:hypothetical protein RM697_10580 [Ichthyenterobacterium sp. W332]|uniref:Calx-beta domain-containing protein n=1 Tax=Microcosmobacter mediterraneus TaxID=3075607 RepID=A0ABU2YMQ8_9FLAO|nr:hypothetical protein [Ichthyenterobacterium sp. W332]MDT0559097.1 hypothetical protein [Ichthyenterobacterium sp. W332]